MYYYIKGTLVQKNDNYIVVDANGVGYMIYTSVKKLQYIHIYTSERT